MREGRDTALILPVIIDQRKGSPVELRRRGESFNVFAWGNNLYRKEMKDARMVGGRVRHRNWKAGSCFKITRNRREKNRLLKVKRRKGLASRPRPTEMKKKT